MLAALLLQIVVPADLAGVLKAFTKEVIRSQPNNVVEFSAKYATFSSNTFRERHAFGHQLWGNQQHIMRPRATASAEDFAGASVLKHLTFSNLSFTQRFHQPIAVADVAAGTLRS